MQEIGVSILGLFPGKSCTCAQVFSQCVLQCETLRPNLSLKAFFGITTPAWREKINASLSCYHCPSKASGLDAAVLTVENTCWLPLHYLGRWYITALAKLLLAGAVTGKSVDILQNSSNKDFDRRMRLWLT